MADTSSIESDVNATGVSDAEATRFDTGGFMYDALFEPITISGRSIKNRVVMAPMVTNFTHGDDTVTDRQIDYYAERARGGVGTIVVEAASIAKTVRIAKHQVGAYDDRFIPGLSKLAGAIRDAGAATLLQLCHGGPKIIAEAGLTTVSVSDVGVRTGDVPRTLTSEEFRQVRRDFVAAARRCQAAGFDGIEIHAAHFYLLSAAISPFTNQREDRYGGDIENRSRLPREVVEDIKAALGDDFSVWVRINACEKMKNGLSLEEGLQAAALISNSGADVIHVSAYATPIVKHLKTALRIPVGGGPQKDSPPGSYLPYAEAVKKAIPVPVVAVGKLDDPALSSKAIASGACDMIALGRQFLCDPYWALKVMEGREDEIVHCDYCAVCHHALTKGKEIICAQNSNLFGEPFYNSSRGRKIQ
jgi:2,4-dienoyl-CoA reductase-like NADH-dependent reductase (Old Yellow Enzyme family)